MNPTRNTVFAALFARVCGATIGDAPAFVTTGRRVKLWSDVPASAQPALFQGEHGESVAPRPRGLPAKITLEAMLYLYSAVGHDPNTVPAASINDLLDAVTDILQPTGPAETGINRCTLGGLVDHCWIEGRVVKDPGDLDGQALAMIPVKILIPYGSPGP